MKIKVGLDIHGIIDTYPQVFSAISHALVAAGHEVHVITGPRFKDVRDDLQKFNIAYTHFCSILEYNEGRGYTATSDEHGREWLDVTVWDQTKADYCREHAIDLHIDDSEVYGQHFTTPYLKNEKQIRE